MDEETRAQIKDLLVKVIIGVIAAFTVSMITVQVPKLTKTELSTIEGIVTGANLVIVILFCLVSLAVPRLTFKGPFIQTEDELRVRTNRLVKQLNTNILLYAFCLIIVYGVYCVNAFAPLEKGFVQSITNLFNFLSSLFIYLSFKVLYDRTLDRDHEANAYWMDALIFAFVGIGTYAFLVYAAATKFTPEQVEIVKKNFSLFIGILNSLAMGLLFARFITMENFLTNIYEADSNGNPNRNQKIIIKNTMIFLLPLYAAVQPIFGNFNLEQAMGPPEIHRNVVFFICFIGKAFFLSVYLYYSHRRWIHLYLYSVLNRQGAPVAYRDQFAIRETYWEETILHTRGSGPVATTTNVNQVG